jgi:hypothetical protein
MSVRLSLLRYYDVWMLVSEANGDIFWFGRRFGDDCGQFPRHRVSGRRYIYLNAYCSRLLCLLGRLILEKYICLVI